MDRGLTMLTLEVETASEDKAYTLISTGPIAIGLELRGKYRKRTIICTNYNSFI